MANQNRERIEMGQTINQEELRFMLDEHQKFLNSGGFGGTFKRMSMAGMEICVYSNKATEGKQLCLSRKKLEKGISLKGANLQYADLSSCICEDISFCETDFSGALMTTSFFAGSRFELATLSGADLSDSDFSDCLFYDTYFIKTDMERAVIDKALFVKCNTELAVNFAKPETPVRETFETVHKFIDTYPAIQEIIQAANTLVTPILTNDEVYYTRITVGNNGYSGGIFYPLSSPGKRDKEQDTVCDAIGSALKNMGYGKQLSDLYSLFPQHSYLLVTVSREKGFMVRAQNAAEIIKYMEAYAIPKACSKTEAHEKHVEAMVEFFIQNKKLAKTVTWNEFANGKTDTSDYCPNGSSESIDALYFALDGKLKSLHLIYKNNKLTLESIPAFPELGLAENTGNSLQKDPETDKRHEAAKEAIRMRHEFYQSLGKLDEREIFLNIGGFSDYPWPGYSTTKQTAKFRVIHTAATTLLITDGLTDVYSKTQHDKDLVYNGIGVEFYVEFDGIHEFDTIRNHYLVTVLNTATQVALAHGDIRKYLDKKITATIEMNHKNLSTYILGNGEQCNDVSSFYYMEHFEEWHDDAFGVLLGMESAIVPKTMQLNLEEVLLVNLRPFLPVWIHDGLREEDQETVDKIRADLINYLLTEEKGNLVNPKKIDYDWKDPATKSEDVIMTNTVAAGNNLVGEIMRSDGWGWILYERPEGLLLNVLLGGKSFEEKFIVLSAEEKISFDEKGKEYIELLSAEIRDNPDNYKNRFVNPDELTTE